MELEIRYCTAEDGVRIAYCIEGDGIPLVVCPFFIESISLHHLIPELPTFLESLGHGRMLVRYDGRGTGLSDREFASDAVPVFGRESFLNDLSAVVDACGLSSFAIWASGTAGPGAVEYSARHSDRVSHLILFNTFASLRSATPGGRPLDQTSAEALASLCELNWPLAAQTFADMTLRQEFPEAALRWSEVFRRSASGETIGRGLRTLDASLDVSSLLAEISAPTLVLHRLEGGMAPFEEGERMARAIPAARLVPLQGKAAHYSFGDTRTVLNAVDVLLGDRAGWSSGQRPSPAQSSPAQRAPIDSRSTAIILFADVVDSTAITARMGNAAFRDRTRQLEAALRDVISEAGGAPVEGRTLGDGVLGVFTSAAQAIEAALQCGQHAERVGLQLHLGIHAGDVMRESGGGVSGIAVSIAARISDLTAPNEILVSSTVRDLARASTRVAFEDRGEYALKGVGEPQRVFAVRQNG